MRYTALAFPLLASLVAAMPQLGTSELSGLPPCAVDAATAALESSGCQPSDTACICSSTAFINAITTTIVKSCSNADVEAALAYAQSICRSPLDSGSPSVSSPATSTPSVTDTATGVSTTTVPVTVTSMTSISGATNTSASVAGTLATSTVFNGSCVASTVKPTLTAAHPAAYTGAAANVRAGQAVIAALVGAAGAAALL